MTGERQAGFTLVEALIAFVIVALALQAAFEIFGGQSRRFGAAERALRAQDVARSALDLVSADPSLAPGQIAQGAADGLSWTVEVSEVEVPAAAGPPRARLLRLDLSVVEPDAPERVLVEVTTLRALPAEPGGAQR